MELVPVKFAKYYTDEGKDTSSIISKIKERDDDLLYCTFNDVRKIVENHYGQRQDNLYKAKLSQVLVCVAAWSQSKQIYRFNSDLAKILADQELEGELPIETLKNVPYKCFYIQTDIIKSKQDSEITDYDGFFVYFDRNEYSEDDLELRMLILAKNKKRQIQVPIHLIKGKTLAESLKTTYNEIGCGYKPKEMLLNDALQEFLPMVTAMLQLILYLCAENKDVVEKKRLEFDKRTPDQKKKKKNKQLVTKKEVKVKEYEVGSVISREFKRQSYSPKEPVNVIGSESGRKKSPHMRKAHWHHFWTGTKENRHLIIKWIPPMYINKQDALATNTTVNYVSK